MSEQIDVRTGTTIGGAGGDAARGKGTALARWVNDEPAGTRGHYPRRARLLARWQALTSALWTVQHAICAPAHRRPRPALHPAPASLKASWAGHPLSDLERHLEASHGRP